MSVAPVCAPGYSRAPRDWLEDLAWHRQMYAQSKFQWAPEDAMGTALDYTKGQLDFTTVEHLRFLAAQQMKLRDRDGVLLDTAAGRLVQARAWLDSPALWSDAQALLGLTELEARIIIETAMTWRPRQTRDVARALRGIPLTNPLTQAWELLAMHSMFKAADGLLEDTVCDLVRELLPHTGPEPLVPILRTNTVEGLQMRLEDQLAERGAPGDERRHPVQSWPAQL